MGRKAPTICLTILLAFSLRKGQIRMHHFRTTSASINESFSTVLPRRASQSFPCPNLPISLDLSPT
nr:hypothetical protein Q903MT_gene3670 [Picea sitchensis]